MKMLIFPIELPTGHIKWVAMDSDDPKISCEGRTKEEAEERLKRLELIWIKKKNNLKK